MEKHNHIYAHIVLPVMFLLYTPGKNMVRPFGKSQAHCLN